MLNNNYTVITSSKNIIQKYRDHILKFRYPLLLLAMYNPTLSPTHSQHIKSSSTTSSVQQRTPFIGKIINAPKLLLIGLFLATAQQPVCPQQPPLCSTQFIDCPQPMSTCPPEFPICSSVCTKFQQELPGSCTVTNHYCKESRSTGKESHSFHYLNTCSQCYMIKDGDESPQSSRAKAYFNIFGSNSR